MSLPGMRSVRLTRFSVVLLISTAVWMVVLFLALRNLEVLEQSWLLGVGFAVVAATTYYLWWYAAVKQWLSTPSPPLVAFAKRIFLFALALPPLLVLLAVARMALSSAN